MTSERMSRDTVTHIEQQHLLLAAYPKEFMVKEEATLCTQIESTLAAINIRAAQSHRALGDLSCGDIYINIAPVSIENPKENEQYLFILTDTLTDPRFTASYTPPSTLARK